MITKEKMSFFECVSLFLMILFKYLINIGFSRKKLYVFLFVALIIAIIGLYNKKLKKAEWSRILIFFIISMIYVFFYSDANFLIALVLALLCLKRNNNDFIKIFFMSSLFLFIGTIFLNYINLIPDHNIYRIINNEIKVRYSLGFTYPNEVFLYFLPIMLTGYCLFSDKKLYYIIIAVTGYLLYDLSDCRTGFYLVIIFIALDFILKKFNITMITKYIPYMFIILTVLSIVVASMFGIEKNSNFISTWLNNRPYFWNYYIENGKILSLFGNNKVEGFFLDNVYIYLLVQLGSFGFCIYWYIYYVALNKMKDNYKYMMCSFVFLLYGFFEANVIIGSIQFLFAIQLKVLIENKYEEGYGNKREELVN